MNARLGRAVSEDAVGDLLQPKEKDYERYQRLCSFISKPYKGYCRGNLINKSAVFDALAAAGIASVLVEFDGEGDSGQIEYICADDSAEIPQISIEMQHVAWGTGKLDSVHTTLRQAIEKLCYDFLSQEHGGWENNDGAYGEFTFDVAERTVNLDFNARFTDFTHFSHSF